jgi:hypothetical protein
MAQGEGPEFKPRYSKQRKKKKIISSSNLANIQLA